MGEKVLLFTSHSERINNFMQKIVAIERRNHNLRKHLELINIQKNIEQINFNKIYKEIENLLCFFHYNQCKLQKLRGDEVKVTIHHTDLSKRNETCMKKIKGLRLTVNKLKQTIIYDFFTRREKLRHTQIKYELQNSIQNANIKKNYEILTWSEFIENRHKNIFRVKFNLGVVLKLMKLRKLSTLNIMRIKFRVETSEISLIAMNIIEKFLRLKKNIFEKTVRKKSNRVNCIPHSIHEIEKRVII